jgi:hypothetical protein
MEQELDHHRSAFRQHPLEVVELRIAAPGLGLVDLPVDGRHQNVIVVAAVEHDDLARAGNLPVGIAPMREARRAFLLPRPICAAAEVESRAVPA